MIIAVVELARLMPGCLFVSGGVNCVARHSSGWWWRIQVGVNGRHENSLPVPMQILVPLECARAFYLRFI